MKDLEEMSSKELMSLEADIVKELERRKRLDYDKALAKFFGALEELSSRFPCEYCFADESTTWEELRENYDWNF